MQVVARRLCARHGPVVFVAPLVLPHDKNPYRLLFIHAIRGSLQKKVVPAKHGFIEIERQVRSEIYRAYFALVPSARVAAHVNHQPLPAACRFRARFVFESHVIPERAAKKNVVPGAHAENGNLNLRVVLFDGPLLPVVVVARMRQPVAKVRRESRGRWSAQDRIRMQRQSLGPAQRIAGRTNTATHGVFREARSPRFVEPLLECAALVGPAIVVVGRGVIGANSREMRRRGNGGQILRGPDVGTAKHSDLAIRIRKRRGPFHRVVTILRFELEGIPIAFRGVAAADILRDHHVTSRRGLQAELHVAFFVIRRAHQQHRELAVGFGAVDVRAQSDAVAHLCRDVLLHYNFVGLGGSGHTGRNNPERKNAAEK